MAGWLAAQNSSKHGVGYSSLRLPNPEINYLLMDRQIGAIEDSLIESKRASGRRWRIGRFDEKGTLDCGPQSNIYPICIGI